MPFLRKYSRIFSDGLRSIKISLSVICAVFGNTVVTVASVFLNRYSDKNIPLFLLRVRI
jgi:hypothetical protein